MGYFDNCTPDQRFYSNFQRGPTLDHNGSMWVVRDWDQRRTISVATPLVETDEDFIFEALAEHVDDIPLDTISIEIGKEGELISCSSDIDKDYSHIPFYPSASEFSSDVPRIHRSQLVELDRMGVQVDLVTERSEEDSRMAFKYTLVRENVPVIWHEINCLLRIPPHANIVPLDRIVVDIVGGDDKLVGYTTPFVPGGLVADVVSRPFKLKHLEQLLSVVDYLNLELGIVHGDVCLHNLLIDPETDDLKLFDFNFASKLGWEGDPQKRSAFRYEPDRNDVKYTVFTLYEIITRDVHFREENYPEELETHMVTSIDPWEKHPQVCLDAEVPEYRRLLDDWVDARKESDETMTHWTQARNPLDWPCLPQFPLMPWASVPFPSISRADAVSDGHDFLTWQRPSSCELPVPEGQQLLATGQVVDKITGEIVGTEEA